MCSPKIRIEFLTSLPQNVTVIGHRAFKEAAKVKLGHMRRRGLIHYEWCPYRRRLVQGQRNYVRREVKDGHLQDKERSI